MQTGFIGAVWLGRTFDLHRPEVTSLFGGLKVGSSMCNCSCLGSLRSVSLLYVCLSVCVSVWTVSARHAAHNVSVNTSRSAAKLTWMPAYDSGLPLHYVIWWDGDYLVKGMSTWLRVYMIYICVEHLRAADEGRILCHQHYLRHH